MNKLLLASLIITLAYLVPSKNQAQEGVWKTYTRVNSGLIGDSIMSIAFDATDTVWLAAYQGVARQTATGWKFVNTQTEIPSNEIWDMDYTNGNLWFAHHNGLTSFDGSLWSTFTTTNSGLVNSPVLCLAHDGQFNLWIGTARGLNRYSAGKTWTTYKHENTAAIPYNGIEALATDQFNTVWMSFISTAGIVKFPGGNSEGAKYLKQDSIPGFPKGAVYIKCLAVDWNGNLWAGTARHGVIRINESGATVFSHQTTPVIKSDTIHSVMIDRCGNVWIGTETGACMYDGSSWYGFSKNTGQLPHDYVYTIEVDAASHAWIGTKGGLTEFKPLPKAPLLVAPSMSVTISTDSVRCKWDWVCPGITNFWFEIADNPNFTNSRVDTTSLSLAESASKLETGLANNTSYYWRIKAKNDAGWGPFSATWIFHVSFPSSIDRGTMMESRCTMMQNYPNPCSERTTIDFILPRHQQIVLTIYDMLGRECAIVMNDKMGPGYCSVPIDVSMLRQNGLYVYRLIAGDEILQRMMNIVR